MEALGFQCTHFGNSRNKMQTGKFSYPANGGLIKGNLVFPGSRRYAIHADFFLGSSGYDTSTSGSFETLPKNWFEVAGK